MKRYLSKIRVEMVLSLLNEESDFEGFEFFKTDAFFAPEQKFELQVSWSSIGKVPASGAVSFAKALKEKSEIACDINDLDVCWRYNSDDPDIYNAATYAAAWADLKAVCNADPKNIVKWIVEHSTIE